MIAPFRTMVIAAACTCMLVGAGNALPQDDTDREKAAAALKLGSALYAKKDLDGAMEQFKKSIELDPKVAQAYASLGIVLIEKKDIDGAIEQFKKSIEVDPKYAAGYSNLGLALRQKKNL